MAPEAKVRLNSVSLRSATWIASLALVFALMAAMLSLSATSSVANGSNVVGAIFAAVAAAFLGGMVRCTRIGLKLTPDGVVHRRFWETDIYPWPTIGTVTCERVGTWLLLVPLYAPVIHFSEPFGDRRIPRVPIMELATLGRARTKARAVRSATEMANYRALAQASPLE